MALNLAPFGRWTLRDKAAQRRLALRWAKTACSPLPQETKQRKQKRGQTTIFLKKENPLSSKLAVLHSISGGSAMIQSRDLIMRFVIVVPLSLALTYYAIMGTVFIYLAGLAMIGFYIYLLIVATKPTLIFTIVFGVVGWLTKSQWAFWIALFVTAAVAGDNNKTDQ